MFLTGVTDLQIGAGPAGPVLYASTGPSGGIAAYGLGAGGFVSLDRISLPGSAQAGLGSTIAPMQIGGADVLMATGAGGTGLWAVGLDASGGFSAPVTLQGPGGGPAGLPPGLTGSLCVAVDGAEYIYASRIGAAVLGVWELAADGTLTQMRAPGAAGAAGGPSQAGFAGLASIRVGATTFLLGADSTGNALVCYQIGAAGIPLELDRLGAAQGLGIAAPTALATAMIDGRAYVLLAAAGSGTVSVAEVSASGQMFVRDHVMDDLATRFAGITALETISIAGRVYVATGGADDGISLFELLPGGRLLHLATLADGLDTTLNNVSAIALAQVGGDLQIVVSSASDPGMTWFSVDLSDNGARVIGTGAADTLAGTTGADLISGSTGDDRLYGGAGNDILLDGTGADILAGGAGADSFVLSVDGLADRIVDFDPTQDTIDLSAWAFLRNTGQLAIMTTADGAEIRFGTEVLRIVTSTGQPLSAAQIRGMGLLDLSRLLPSWFPTEAPAHTLLGGSGTDTLIGQYAGDLLRGADGADSLTGKGGDDFLYGDAGNDILIGDEGNDALIGGTGLDRLFGGAGADRLWGDDANDVLYGGTEADLLWGMIGNDFLAGDAGNDLLYADVGDDALTGGAGIDRLYGGLGRDKLFGDDGNDILYGGTDADLLRGGAGDDYLAGELGNDVFYGEVGADLLTGGLGADFLFGGLGRDKLFGNEQNDVLYGGIDVDTLWGQTGDDYMAGDTENDLLYGSDGTDRLTGGAGADVLYGGTGADRLWGDAGNDVLSGDDGNDRLDGGIGRDSLRGGAGADTFVFAGGMTAVTAAGTDRILDFTDNVDTLVLSAALWGGARWSVAQVLSHATMTNGHVVFDFGHGNTLTIDGLPRLSALSDDLVIW